jgi:choline dehydrogenase-like flavoprotein
MASFASELDADLCVVGSGIAGMLLAEKALARGRRVLMLERGTPLSFDDRRRLRSHDDPLAFNRSPHFSRHEAQPVGPRTRGREYAFHPVYNLGGSTNHFYGNMPRIHPAHFQAGAFGGASRHWPLTYAELEPYYLEAELRLKISGNSERTPFPGRFAYPLPPHRLSPSDRACEAIFGAEHVMQVPTVRPSEAVDQRPKCCGTNLCDLCPIDSKGTALNTVYPSIRERVDLHSGLLVTEIHCRSDRVTSLSAVDAEGRSRRIRARQFVVACNGVDSCLLLQRSGDVPKHQSLGRHYMDHPMLTFAVYGSGFDARPGYGDSAQTGMITTFFERLGDDLPVSMLGEIKLATLAMNQGEGGNRDTFIQDITRRSIEQRSFLRRSLRDKFREHFASTLELVFLVESQPLPQSTVSIRRIETSGQAIPEISIPYPEYLGTCIERVTSYIRQRLPGAEVRHLSTYPGSHHWLGATRMADSPQDGCVDRNLRYYGLENLYVLGGSTFPSSSSANPTLTLSALALRLGDHLASGDRATDRPVT